VTAWEVGARVLAVLAGSAGALFFLAGTLGLVRLPDFFSRAHAAAKCDTVGAGFILVALALALVPEPGSAKVLGLAVLVLVAGPTASHALARAAWRTGLRPWTRDLPADGEPTEGRGGPEGRKVAPDGGPAAPEVGP
jgi:multicomponent Na+:H+ antiporter subunit G